MARQIYIITGPTASGKSDFAHALAKRVGGAIINADSVQIYSGIENISASPSLAEGPTALFCASGGGKKCTQGNSEPSPASPAKKARLCDPSAPGPGENEVFARVGREGLIDGVPYKLFSILPLTEQISVADYLNLARAELDNLPPDTPAIFVGGTGFYINALINGISPMPNVSPENRRRAREQIARNPSQLCCAAVNGLDPQRAARALEVLLETGKPIEYWQSLPRTGGLATSNQQPTAILINPPRETINARIAARIPKMLSGGALREAENIIAKELPENRAIGSAQLCKYLRGEISESDAIENWTTKTQQYAKRQRTWFRTQFTPDIIIDNIPTENDINKIKEV